MHSIDEISKSINQSSFAAILEDNNPQRVSLYIHIGVTRERKIVTMWLHRKRHLLTCWMMMLGYCLIGSLMAVAFIVPLIAHSVHCPQQQPSSSDTQLFLGKVTHANQLQTRWDEKYQQLVDYREEHGDCNVPQNEGPLGTWVDNQRRSYRRYQAAAGNRNVSSGITSGRIEKLEQIGFVWDPVSKVSAILRPKAIVIISTILNDVWDRILFFDGSNGKITIDYW